MNKSGISQIGGKFRLKNVLLEFVPIHEYFLSLFCGSCIFEINKPRPFHYECFNDANSEYINYLEVLQFFPDEFDKHKKGILGLVSRRIYTDIKEGFIKPKDRIEKAVMFQYLVKLGYGSTVQFRGVVPETTSKKEYIEKAKKDFIGKIEKAGFKGMSLGKTTRPYTNNDMGILTPLDRKAVKRLRYVIIEENDFLTCYVNFHRAYFIRKGLVRECFIYADPPFPSTEFYYGGLFPIDRHIDLIEIMLRTPFNFMLSIGGDCQVYLYVFEEAGWLIEGVKVKYSTDANTQDLKQEYLIMNYRIEGVIYEGNGKYCNYNPDLPVYPLMKKDLQRKKDPKQTNLGDFQ